MKDSSARLLSVQGLGIKVRLEVAWYRRPLCSTSWSSRVPLLLKLWSCTLQYEFPCALKVTDPWMVLQNSSSLCKRSSLAA